VSHQSRLPSLASTLLMLGLATNVVAVDIPLGNWTAPAAWSASAPEGAKGLLAETKPMPFLAVTPCRIADTRNAAGPYGGPSLAANTTRDFTITGQCGIPVSARAVSLNLAVTTMNTNGNLIAWPQGGAIPNVSVINWNATSVAIANATVVQLGVAGGMSVRSNVPAGGVVDLIIDVNGYYYDDALGTLATGEYFGVIGSYNGGGGVLFSSNTDMTVIGFGLNSYSSSPSTGSAGVRGTAFASSGITYGVRGQSLSTNPASAGVYGVDSTGDPGTAGATQTVGVYGASKNGFGGYFSSGNIGMKVTNNNSGTGAVNTIAYLGFSSITAIQTTGAVNVGGNFTASGTKSFVDPHPTDFTKAIAYVALEGPEAGTYFRGRGRIHDGVGTIEVPESFRLVSDEEGLTVQITPIGHVANVAVMSLDLNSVTVKSSVRELEFFYVVNGVRRSFKNFDPIVASGDYFRPEGPDSRIPAFLSDQQKAALVANGTYNADGTVNMKTAAAAGWVEEWEARAAERKQLAEKARKLEEETSQMRDLGHNMRTN
jgi:hypothetical protein